MLLLHRQRTVQFGENEVQTALARDDHLLDAISRHKGQQICRTTACTALIRRKSIYIQRECQIFAVRVQIKKENAKKQQKFGLK